MKKILTVFLFILVINFTNNNILGKTIIESDSIKYYDYYTEAIYSNYNVIDEPIYEDNTTEDLDNNYIESIDDNNTIYYAEDNNYDDNYLEEEIIKNGWYKENGKRYYYENNKKVKNAYVDYIYLNSKGVAQKKIGNFSATLYGSKAWAKQQLNIRKKATINSSIIGNVPLGGKVTILSCENQNTKYIKIKYNKKFGYVYSDYLYINLPDVIPDIVYSITNANHSIYKSAGQKIPNVTSENLYGYTKQYNAKIGKYTYYAPILYPVAKNVQKAYNKAQKQGYNLKIYDTYRPYSVSQNINNEFRKLYNSNTKVKNKVNYDKNKNYWGPTWFLANSVSRHNRGIALDLTLTDSNNNELKAQTSMHTLDTRSLRKYNNSVSQKLSSIMTSAGFETLESEWWHFEEDDYKFSNYTSFKIR